MQASGLHQKWSRAISPPFGGFMCQTTAVFKMYADAFGQICVSKALFQYKMHAQASYRCARRSRAACRSGVSNPSVNQAYRSLSCRLASSDRCCTLHNRARLIVARSSKDRACCARAIEIARRSAASASDASAPCRSSNSPRSRCNSASHQRSLCVRASASASSMHASPCLTRPAFPQTCASSES